MNLKNNENQPWFWPKLSKKFKLLQTNGFSDLDNICLEKKVNRFNASQKYQKGTGEPGFEFPGINPRKFTFSPIGIWNWMLRNIHKARVLFSL